MEEEEEEEVSKAYRHTFVLHISRDIPVLYHGTQCSKTRLRERKSQTMEDEKLRSKIVLEELHYLYPY